MPAFLDDEDLALVEVAGHEGGVVEVEDRLVHDGLASVEHGRDGVLDALCGIRPALGVAVKDDGLRGVDAALLGCVEDALSDEHLALEGLPAGLGHDHALDDVALGVGQRVAHGGLGRLHGLSGRCGGVRDVCADGGGRRQDVGLLLAAGRGGEFAFIVIGMALALGLLERQVGQFMLIVVGVSMLVAPVVARLGQSLGDNIDRRAAPPAPEDMEVGELGGHVIIAGYGRVGQMVGQMLAEQGVAFVAIENDAQLIAHQRKAGVPLVFGDASRPELLRKLRIDQARAVVLTMDHTAAAIHAVQGIRRLMPMMRIIARARDEKHALLLREAGASVVVPETLESSLKLTGWVLETLGVPPDAAMRLLEQERERRIVALRDTGAGAAP